MSETEEDTLGAPPTSVVVSREAFEKLLHALDNPKGPNQKLIDLMRMPSPPAYNRQAEPTIRETALGRAMQAAPPLTPDGKPLRMVDASKPYWIVWTVFERDRLIGCAEDEADE